MTIEPPDEYMALVASRVQRKVPVRFVSITELHLERLIVARCPSLVIPEFKTAASRRP